MRVTITISKEDVALLREWNPEADSTSAGVDLVGTQRGLMERLRLAALVERILKQVARG